MRISDWSSDVCSSDLLASLMELVDDYRIADHQSASVLEAYLDRVRPEWRGDGAAGESEAGTGGAEDGNQAGDHQAGGQRQRGPRPAGAMTRAEALEILGLEEDAGAEAISAAHRRLMTTMHPDHGRSNYLAPNLHEAQTTEEQRVGHAGVST